MIKMMMSKLNQVLRFICETTKMMIENQRQIKEEQYKTLDLNYPFYIKREADEELFDYLKDGYLCYVFNSRKMGKSSLYIRVRDKLEKENFKCVLIDLTGIGLNYSVDKWYNTLIRESTKEIKELKLHNEAEFNIWWEQLQNRTNIYKFQSFLEELLNTFSQNILIVVDEIDVFLDAPTVSDAIFSQKDKNEFFSFIRRCYNNRANNSNYQRLVFCLIGVYSVSDLISEAKLTPFNVGHPIELNGFTFEQAKVLIQKLKHNNILDPDEVLREIIEWTNGQPFLTQRLCDLIINPQNKHLNLNDLVEEQIVKVWDTTSSVDYFTRIQKEIVKRDEKNLGRRLRLYQRILEMSENQGIEADGSKEQEQLCLSGLVIKKEGRLRVANKIFSQIFDNNWVVKNLDRLRVYPEELALQWESAKDESLLLTGQNLQEAIAWKQRMGTIIDNVDANFIEESKVKEKANKVIGPQQREIDLKMVILQMRERLVGKITDWENIASEILKWTNRDFDLSKIICESIDFTSTIVESTEQERVRKWIEENIINNWENSPLAEKIDTIRNCLLDIERSFLRLETYQKILKGESTTIDSELFDSGLIKDDNGLRVANRIYESIFNPDWIKNNLPPYAEDFTAWRKDLNSEKLDSHLLNGEDLKQALDWIQNKPQLNELELEFIITSVVWEMWSSGEAVNAVNAVNKVKDFLPQLQEKTKTRAHLVRVIQAILEGTKPQLVLLQAVLQWVREAEVIPTEDEAKWLEEVVRSHLRGCDLEQVAQYLDFKDTSNAIWQELKNENAFIIIDEFLEKKEPSQEDIDKVKNYKKRLDNAQVSIYTTGSATNFQPLILDILHSKFERAYNMAGQKDFDQLLDQIVADAGGDLEAIIIFDLSEGLPLYHNKGLKDRNAKLYTALFGEGDDIGGEAIKGFDTLDKMQQAFRNFGEKTEFKDSTSIIVNFANGKMMIYFHQAPDIPTAICFMASKEINLGSINRRANQFISNIKQKLDEL